MKEFAGVTITHPDRVIFPKTNITKLDIAQYYSQISEKLLPELIERPVSLVRSPGGLQNGKFYQKHPSEAFPKYIERITITERQGEGIYITLDAQNDLIFLSNIGVIEFHAWLSSLPDLEAPDRIVFDLDPAPDAPWGNVIDAAKYIHDELQEHKLFSCIKTSGIKGLHIVIPIKNTTWEHSKAFARGIADHLAEKYPSKFTTTIAKDKREGKVFIDYLRNSRGATNVAAFSLRTHADATVSFPFAWKDLSTDIRPYMVTMKNYEDFTIPEEWKKLYTVSQKLMD